MLTFSSQPHCFDSFRVNAAAASRAASVTIVTVSIATTVISLSHLALNIWRNCLPSPLELSKLKHLPKRLNRHIPRYVYVNAFDTDPFPSSSRLGRRNFEYVR